jgi:malate dehydrogenase (oxaloacetate-decarboxylating)(NADP+)
MELLFWVGGYRSEASKPVMEGKGFKILLILMCLTSKWNEDIEEFIQTVKNIAPTFGGINLEGISKHQSHFDRRRWLRR